MNWISKEYTDSQARQDLKSLFANKPELTAPELTIAYMKFVVRTVHGLNIAFRDLRAGGCGARVSALSSLSRSLLKFGGDPAHFTLLPDRIPPL